MNVTVITAIYNTALFLKESVESVANQTVRPKEHLLIDDCSTDNSLAIAYELAKKYPYIRVISHKKNKGYPAALNTGIQASKTKFIGIMDSDDIALPDWLETVMPIMADLEIGSAGGGCIIMTELGEVTQQLKYCEPRGDVTEIIQTGGYPMLHPGTIHRRENLINIGCYNPLLRSFEDNDVFLSMSSVSKLFSVGKPLVYYRRLRESESRKTVEFSKQLKCFLVKKAELLAKGKTTQESNKELAMIINELQMTPRLVPSLKGAYEYEMACSFRAGGLFIRAMNFYFQSIRLGHQRKSSCYHIVYCMKAYLFQIFKP